MKNKIFTILTIISTVFSIFTIDAGTAEAEMVHISEPIAEVNEEIIDDPEYNAFEDCMNRSNEIMNIEDKEEKLIQYMDLICEYRDLLEPPVLLEDYFTEEEIYLMAKCVETEVYQQSFNSKVNVAAVIFNRLYSEKFACSVDKIVVDGQFAFWRTEISEDTYRALQYAWLFGADCKDALFFNSFPTPVCFYGEYSGYTDEAGHNFYR